MVFSRSGSCYKALPAAFGERALAQVSYNRRTMYLAVALGAVLFSAGFFLARNGDGKSIPLIAFIYTPLFSLPLTASLVKHRRIGFWGSLILMFGFSAAHFLAVYVADRIYDFRVCNFLMAPSRRPARRVRPGNSWRVASFPRASAEASSGRARRSSCCLVSALCAAGHVWP